MTERRKPTAQTVDQDFLYRLRHSTAHVMAGVVLEMFPEGKIAIGPPIEDGFYYDFDLPRPLTPEDLEKIEARMREVIAEDHPFVRRVVSPEEARALFRDQPYKLELIDSILQQGTDEYGERADGNTELTTYRHDAFEDLCRGPHLERTGQIPVDGFKLLSVAGAYWRGDERRPMLQRIYGTAWPSKEELERYLAWREEVERRDHRRLGKELDLFSIHPDLGGGLILWHPKGAPSVVSPRTSVGRSTKRPVTSSSTHLISGAAGCGRSAATSISSGRTCTPPSRSTDRSTI